MPHDTRCRLASSSNQGHLFASGDSCSPQHNRPERRVFVEPNPRGLHFGALTLDAYLSNVGERAPLAIARLLASLDWQLLETHYDGAGRPPYAPRLMAGLVMYGLFKGVSSLRGLEMLARTDLGCMWVCAGIQPDHSNLGRFILRHAEQLEGAWFEDVTARVLKATGSDASSVAADGTVIQAMGSRYRTLKREALEAKLDAARARCSEVPQDEQKQAAQEKYTAAEAALAKREQARAQQRKPTDTLRVCTTEPEAPVQPLKNKSFAPSYKASVLANSERVIVGKAVDPSSEIAPMPAMLSEAERIAKARIRELLADGGYCTESVIEQSLQQDISLLCRESGDHSRAKKLQKSEFVYDEERDCYTCPQGHELTRARTCKTQGYVQYEARDCRQCPLRDKCLSSKRAKARTIKRYPVDAAKDALRAVMSQRQAARRYAQRKAMVEPVFAFLTGRMGVRRFRRRGLTKVRTEFALYAAAYNIGRYVAAAAAAAVSAALNALARLLRSRLAPTVRIAVQTGAAAA